MDERHDRFAGLVGFIVAGPCVVAVGIRVGDAPTVIGGVVWIGVCVVRLIPVLGPTRD